MLRKILKQQIISFIGISRQMILSIEEQQVCQIAKLAMILCVVLDK